MTATTPMPEELVIAAYGAEVPCVMQLMPDGCDNPARFLVRFEHDDGTKAPCDSPMERTPFCRIHKEMIEKTFTGFWAELAPPDPCPICGRRFRVASIEPINASS